MTVAEAMTVAAEATTVVVAAATTAPAASMILITVAPASRGTAMLDSKKPNRQQKASTHVDVLHERWMQAIQRRPTLSALIFAALLLNATADLVQSAETLWKGATSVVPVATEFIQPPTDWLTHEEFIELYSKMESLGFRPLFTEGRWSREDRAALYRTQYIKSTHRYAQWRNMDEATFAERIAEERQKGLVIDQCQYFVSPELGRLYQAVWIPAGQGDDLRMGDCQS